MPTCLYLTDPYTESRKEVEIDLNSTLEEFRETVSHHTGIQPQEQGTAYILIWFQYSISN